MEELKEPDDEKKLDLRREKQAARSSRIIYDLQQQVQKESNMKSHNFMFCPKDLCLAAGHDIIFLINF